MLDPYWDQPDLYETQAVAYWGGDPLLTAVMEGDPRSDLAAFVIDFANLDFDHQHGKYADFRAARVHAGLTSAEAADACKVSLVTWVGWEYGWGTHSTGTLLCRAFQLGIPAALFFHDRELELNPFTRLRNGFERGH